MTAHSAQSALNFWKRWVSPALPAACRFHPTCSEYAAGAIAHHGVVRGSLLGLGRILRCNPFSRGGFDPVPLPIQPKTCDQDLRSNG